MSKERGWYEFIVKGNKTTCLFHHPDFEHPFVGRARWNPDDLFPFVAKTGREIAQLRAHVKYHKAVCKELDARHEVYFEAAKKCKKRLFKHEDTLNALQIKVKKLTGKEDKTDGI